MTGRRVAAASALVLACLTSLLALFTVIEQFPLDLLVLGCAAVALAAGWYGLLRRGPARIAGFGLGLAAFAACLLILILDGDHGWEAVLIGVGIVATLAAARAAFRRRVPLPPARRPERPVLFYNPKSGGGKAGRFSIDREAKERGIEPIELTPRTDLAELVHAAIARGADALAMAGGDGSQAVVAESASEHGLPYA